MSTLHSMSSHPELAIDAGGIFQYLIDVHPSSWLALCLVAAIIRFLKLLSSPERPKIFLKPKADICFMHQLLEAMPILNQVYRPPWLWGRSGHLQTAAYGLLGHSSLKRTGKREGVKITDGSTVTFDIFEPLAKHSSGLDVTLCLTPGIANSAESNYIRTCVHYAQEGGYSFLCIGFSMGANITTRFLLQTDKSFRKRVLLGLSVGQGYSASVSAPMYHDWENGRRAYNYVITENMKRLLRRNYAETVVPHSKAGLIDEQRLWSCTSIIAFDEQYSRRVAGFASLEEFYNAASCLPHLHKLKVPMVFLNAHDDPIIPKTLWEPVRNLAMEKEEIAFITTKHGGHLGFLEGPSISPLSVTWLDRLIVQVADAACQVYGPKQ